MKWTSDSVRDTFLEFYGDRGHRRMSSLALIPPGDPTLLFTNAGMVQFKDVFVGKTEVNYASACSSQKCLRVSGKHNDLENVGRTARHHTFFEMLGNFSFGQYFKEGAISSAWELITEVYKLPVEKLYVTVHPDDDEAREIWSRVSNLPLARILDDPENFWSMGDTGPCGPCSEIHYDQGNDLSGGKEVPFGEGGDRYLEIWNLVFMQYDRDATGTLTPLPRPCIDTGMGLERITALLQGHQSNYHTDLFMPLITRAARKAKVTYGEDEERDVALRVIADHARSTCFLIADGIYPENEGRGYVIRRIMRRAMRFGRKLGLKDLFLVDVCDEVVKQMGDTYGELKEKAAVIKAVVTQEEKRFGRTLDAGCKRLDEAFASNEDSKVVPGKIAFELYDTHGFPLDLTEQAAAELDFVVDREGFESLMAKQREMGRASWKGDTTDDSEWESLREKHGRVSFVGYEQDDCEGTVIGIINDGKAILTNQTTFYAESGGQVGDTGTISNDSGSFNVTDTRSPIDGVVVHCGEMTSGKFSVGDTVKMSINTSDRNLTRKNHSATHLLHLALRESLGDHVKQRGSLVGPHRLRFDFSHFNAMTSDELQKVELAVNQAIIQNAIVQTDLLSKEEAVSRGAVAFFGDKYGEQVRMLTITADSVELCGGTHVNATGEMGLFKIVSESSIASGVRRIEGVTGIDALKLVHTIEQQLSAAAEGMKSSVAELPVRLQKLQDDHLALQKELESLRAQQRSAGLSDAEPVDVGGIALLAMELDGVKGGDLRDMSDKARQRLGSGIVFLASKNGPKVALLVAVTDDLKDRFPAGKLIGELAPLVGGRGGGRPDLAQAGGNDASKIGAAMSKIRVLIQQGELA